jgi:NAD(P)H dehydrogenase (quinone)
VDVSQRPARGANIGDFLTSNLRYYVEDHKQGAFALGAPTNDVLEVTGRPAEDFETTARRYAARPEAQRTFANWLRTLTDFMAHSVDSRLQPGAARPRTRFPAPPLPLLAMSNELWKVERGELSVLHSISERSAVHQTLVGHSA